LIPQLPEAQNVLVVGPVASGKSWLLEKWFTIAPRVLIFDVTGEIGDGDGRLRHVGIHDIKVLAEHERFTPRYKMVFHAGAEFGDEVIEHQFRDVLKAFWDYSAPRHFFIDEVQTISRMPATDTALRFARKRLLGIVGATQRLVDVTTTYRDNARMVVLFHTQEGNSLDCIRDSWGSDARDTVTELKPLIYDDVNKRVIQKPQALIFRRGYPLETVELG